jgi:hypothetical protein
MASAGAASRAVPGSKFVPLSVFFLQLAGEDGEEGEEGIQGYVEKGKAQKAKTAGDKPLGPMHFDASEKHRTTALKGPRPKAKPRKDLGEGEDKPFTGTASKPQKCKFCDEQASKSLIWAEGRAYVPVCDQHEDKGRAIIKKNDTVSDGKVVYVRKIDEDTTTANVAAYPRPIGVPMVRRAPMDSKKRKKWMDRLSRSMNGA